MEENKKNAEQTLQNNGNAGNGGRKRRRRHGKHRGNGNNGNSGNNGGNQSVNNQTVQKKQEGGQKPVQNGGNNTPKKQRNDHKNKSGNKNNQGNQNGGQKNQTPPQNSPKKQPQQPQNNNAKKQKDENRKDTYLYIMDGNLYVNLTNKCSNGCDFCVRNERDSYYGNYLWLRNGDPTAEKVMAAAKGYGDLSRFKEVVFCGFGEPTYKVAEMVALCDYFHEKGLKTRLNTNGQGNLINKRDIVPDLVGKIDFVNVSLNASCVEKYQPICRSQFGEAGFSGMIDFAKLCRRNGIDCRFSIVDCIGEEEVEACKRLAESVNVPLYIRKYLVDSD